MRGWAPREETKSALDRVLDLGGDKAMRVLVVAFVLTIAAHGAAAVRTGYIHAEMIAWTLHLDAVLNARLAQQIDIETEKAPEQKVVEEKKEEQPVEKMVVKQDTPVAAARASQILSANPNDVMDFTKDVYNVGESERFSGGDTRSDGTNDKAVSAPHVAAVGTGNGASPAPPQIVAVDLSRTATLAGSGEWRCPFPPEADADQVDEAAAIIEVIVGADGKPSRASILQDPGHGFGREARGCAMRESYVAALDRDGKPVLSSKKFRVKFER
jgi:protein TonB